MKKNLRFLLLVAALLVGPWASQAQNTTLPFSCTFENSSDTVGWVLENGTQTNKWYIGTVVANSSTSSLYISNNGTSNAYTTSSTSFVYAYKEVTLAAGMYYLSFDWQCAGEDNYDYLQAFLVPSTGYIEAGSGADEDWTTLSNQLTSGTIWQNSYTEFSVETAGTYRLVFYWMNDFASGSNPPAAVDNILLDELTCPPPTVTTATTSDSAYFSWTGSTATSYVLEYASGAFTPGTNQADVLTTTNTSLAIDNLSPSTTYYYALRAICAVGDSSSYVTGTFTTSCVPTGIPYGYGAELGDSAATCWSYISDDTYYTPGPNTQMFRTGTSSIVLPADYGVTTYAVLPVLTEPLGNTMISFYANTSTWDPSFNFAKIQVGYMTNATDPTTFVSLMEVDAPNAWTRYDVAMPADVQYPIGSCIAIMAYNGEMDELVCIDDILVDVKPSCPAILNLRAQTTASAALASWSYQPGIVADGPESYTVEYALLSDSYNRIPVSDITGTSAIISNLTNDSTYMLWVYADCDGEHGYGDSIIFTTAGLSCLEYSRNDTLTVGTGTASQLSVFPDYWVNRYQQSLYLASEIADSGNINSLAFNRAAGMTDECSFTNVEIMLGHTTATSLGNIVMPDSTFQMVYSGDLTISGDGWINIPFDHPFHYNGQSNLVVAINTHESNYSANEGKLNFYISNTTDTLTTFEQDDYTAYSSTNPVVSGLSGKLWRPNIRFYIQDCAVQGTCAAPSALITNVTADSVSLSWIAGNTESEWNVYIKTADAAVWQPAVMGTTENSATIGGIFGGNQYQIRVVALCDADDSAYTTVSFSTPCGIIRRAAIPYTANLTPDPNYMGYNLPSPSCWTLIEGDDCGINYYNTVGGRSNPLYVPSGGGLYNANSMIAMPEVEMDVDSLELVFDMFQTDDESHSTVIIGVMDSPDSLESFVAVDTITLTNPATWTTMTVSFANYNGTGKFIAFKADEYCYDTVNVYNEPYFTNIQLYVYSDCRPVSNAYAGNVTNESADIHVMEADEFDNHVLYYSLVNDFASATQQPFMGSTFTLTGLQHSSTYYAWITKNCGDSESRPVAFTFTTLVPCLEVENLQVQTSGANNSAVLSWDAPNGGFAATNYIVSYKEISATTWTSDTVDVAQCYYHITGLLQDVEYQYTVTTLCNEYEGVSNSGTFTIFNSCVVIGTNETTNSYVPLFSNYNYSYSQFIYTAAELSNMGDTIRGMYFYNNGTSSNSVTTSIYVGNTLLDAFTQGETTWTDATTMTKVANDTTVVVSGTGWAYFPFATPFVRDNTKNLIVAIDNNTGTYDWEYPEWAAYTTTNIRSKYYYNDNVNINPDSVVTTAPSAFVPNVPYVRFESSCASAVPCAAPILISSASTGSSITVNWFAGTNETAWTVMYRPAGDTTWTTLVTDTPNTTATITGLTSGMMYDVRVTNYCSTENAYYAQATFSTSCENIALPYAENFETQAEGEYTRACWIAATTNTEDGELPYVENQSTFSKMVSLTNGAYLVAPTFSSNVDDIMVNVTYWSTTSENAHIYVGVMADASSIASFVPVDTLTVNDISRRHSATVRFDNYTGTSGNICFYVQQGYPGGWGNYLYLDNIEFRQASDCGFVDSMWTVNNSNTGIDVAWSVNGTTPTSYTVEYGVSGFTQGQGTTLTTTTASISLTGLTHSTMYDVYVTPICGTTTMFTSAPYSTQTSCDLMAIPYSMNFDLGNLPPLDYTEMLPLCWTVDTMPRTISYYEPIMPQIIISENASSAPAALYAEDMAVMALPQMAVSLDSLQVSFYAYSSQWSNSYALQVGVVDSLTPGFTASFTPIATINTAGGVHETVNFCTYTGSGQYIAFKNIYTGGSSPYAPIYIDDVVVDYRSACMPVYDLTTDNLMMTSLTLNWATCNENSGYEVRYALAGSNMTGAISITTITNTAAITGLLNDSTYEFQVRNFCSNGDTGAWVSVIQTMPPCDGFIDANLFNPNTITGETSYAPAHSYYNYSFSQVVYDSAMLAQQGLNGVSVENFAFYPLNVGPFDSAYTNCRIFISTTNKSSFIDDEDFVAVDSADLVYSGDLNWSEIGWREVILDSSFTWDGHSNIIITIDRDHGEDVSGVQFLTYSGNTNQCIYHYSDEENLNPFDPTLSGAYANYGILSSIPAYRFYGCPSSPCNNAPVVTVEATTPVSANISWTSEASNFEVNIKAAGDANWPATNTTVNGAYTYSFTGLVPATQYQYRVRAICEEGETSDWATAAFTTDSLPCFVPTNLSAAPAMGTAEMSWTNGSDETAWNIHVWNTAFDQTFNATANPFSVTGLTPGTTYQAAIQSVCGGIVTSEYSDTISFTTDICDPVTNVAATVSGTTATVTWTAGENNTGSFAVEYGFAGFAAGTGTTVNATSTTVTLTGLESETNYEVVVRAICDGQYNSNWSNPATFTTEVSINTAEGNNMVNIYPNPAENSTTISVSGVEGEVTVTIVDMNGRTVSTHTMECSGDCEKMMNVENLAAGNYFVRLQGNGLNTVKKLVIK